ncbi:MAG TPA: amino acid permease [Alphaproteobacteria bacterium]|jgi:arginine:agmatine antiporter|nr:amino acid permease [Alphaproteobacteria bacterium]
MPQTTPRKLGPVLATMFVTGNMVGSGLFLLPATLGALGGISVFTWIFATAGALVIAGVFARLGVLAPWAGGPYAYARATLGRFAGFQVNYIYWISCWIGNVGIALAVTGYLTELLPFLKPPLASATTTSAVIWIMVGANIIGPRIVGTIEAAAMLVGLAPILAIGILGWAYFDPSVFAASWNVSGQPTWVAVPRSMVLVFWAFTGLESAAVAVEVVENPKRNLPLAALAGVALAAVIYVVSCTVLMGIVPAKELAESSAPFAIVARRIFGPGAATLLIFTTILKASGTHGGWTLVSAATAKAAAEDGAFPGLFAKIDRRGIPTQSLLAHGVLMTAIAFATASPTIGQQFGKLIDMAVVYSMTTYLLSAIALIRLRKAGEPKVLRDRILAGIAAVFSVWVIVASDPVLLAIAAVLAVTGIPLYPFYKGRPDTTPVVVGQEA